MKELRGNNPLVQIVTNIQYSDYVRLIKTVEKAKKSKSSVVRDAILEYLNRENNNG
jgi:hypothetical protein